MVWQIAQVCLEVVEAKTFVGVVHLSFLHVCLAVVEFWVPERIVQACVKLVEGHGFMFGVRLILQVGRGSGLGSSPFYRFGLGVSVVGGLRLTVVFQAAFLVPHHEVFSLRV